MTPLLFDPIAPPPDAWPAHRLVERRYIETMARYGVPALVSNVRTRWLGLRAGDRLFPVTVNDGEIGDSYVCLPHSAYVLYARQELDFVDVGPLGHLLRPAIGGLDLALRRARINTNVQIDNWLLSTNLHGDWSGAELPDVRRLLAARFPDHFLVLRSLDPVFSPALLEAAREDGWILVPSRQVWISDDMQRDWWPRNDRRNDRAVLRQSGLAVEELPEMREEDARQIAKLYHQLYVGKYSPLNPIFTPAFMMETHRSGMIRYRAARGSDGRLLAVSGLFERDGCATPPVAGYDTGQPQKLGLYRIACLLFAEAALASGLRLNWSAGAASFKRLRGARGVIEYSAFYAGHLDRSRRRTIAFLARALETLVVPMMRRRGL